MIPELGQMRTKRHFIGHEKAFAALAQQVLEGHACATRGHSLIPELPCQLLKTFRPQNGVLLQLPAG